LTGKVKEKWNLAYYNYDRMYYYDPTLGRRIDWPNTINLGQLDAGFRLILPE